MIQVEIFESISWQGLKSIINVWLMEKQFKHGVKFGVSSIALSAMEIDGKLKFVALVTYSEPKK